MNIEEVEKILKTKLESIYLFYGEEKFLLETIVKKIKKQFGELKQGINYIVLDDTNVDKLISEIETPSFGYEKKLIITKNSNIFSKTKSEQEINEEETEIENEKLVNTKQKYLKDLKEYIEKNIEEIRDTVVIVFIEEKVNKNALVSTIDKYGIVCEFKFLKPNEISKRIKAICSMYKVEIGEIEIKRLIEISGISMQNLINEIRKLIEYVGENNKIKIEDVEKLAFKNIETIIFELTDNIGEKNIKKTLQVLNDLFYLKEPPEKIVVILYRHLKKIYLTQLAIKYNQNILQLLELKPNQEFLVSKYIKQAKKFTEIEIRNIIKKLIEIDIKNKTNQIDIKLGLELLISEL